MGSTVPVKITVCGHRDDFKNYYGQEGHRNRLLKLLSTPGGLVALNFYYATSLAVLHLSVFLELSRVAQYT